MRDVIMSVGELGGSMGVLAGLCWRTNWHKAGYYRNPGPHSQ
jgi:hypothetical protein